jgi:predicted dehydrogenase
MSGEKLRFAIFGGGDFGSQFARYVAEAGEVVAVCDPNPAGQALFREAGFDVPAFADHQRPLAETEIDAVAITSPNHTHKEITLAAAALGKHVYCEKSHGALGAGLLGYGARVPQSGGAAHGRPQAPPAPAVGADDRVARSTRAGARHQCVPVLRRSPVRLPRLVDPRGSERSLNVTGVHTTDWMRAMCGDVEMVTAKAGPQIDTRYDFPDNLHVLLSFRSVAVASLAVSFSYPLLKFRESNGPLVVCRDGGMRFLPYMDHIDLFWQHSQDSAPRHERFDDLGFDHAFRKEIRDFVLWIVDGADPCLTWQEGLHCVEVMEAAHRSVREGGSPIRVPLYPEFEPADARAA